ncbi:MAG: MBL fold metallo-hydrolase [Clostridia bacterium]|nr:MBL fold metallo-hydrolase [Clostridia bacterium]MBQ4620986.1 MBL fold metallo-hydrolase [Clostridia bacterium]
MELLFSPLFSGSSGNAIYVGDGESGILVDAGVSCARIIKELENIGVKPESLNAILITHEHTDHTSGAGILSRKFDLPIYATEGTWNGMQDKVGAVQSKNIRLIDARQDFYIGKIGVCPFSIPHDASDPCGFSFFSGSIKASIATDIGCIRDGWISAVSDSDILLLESNYNEDMLKAGKYPYALKKRILSRTGHLSNDDAGKAAVRLVNRNVRNIILGHLSKENNFPQLAEQTVRLALNEAGCEIGRDVNLSIARRDGFSGLFALEDNA